MGGFGPFAILLGSALGMYQGFSLLDIPSLNSCSEQVLFDRVSVNAAFLGQRVLRHPSQVSTGKVGRRLPGGLWSDGDPTASQESPDSSRADSVLATELLKGAASSILIRDIRAIRRFPFSGHVYNLQTVDGWYTSNNIITHNCLCDQSQVLVSIEEFMGAVDDFVKYNTGPLARWFEGQMQGSVRR
jgi:hypothetical protein